MLRIPTLEEYVSDDYLDFIKENWVFVDKGDTIDRWIEECPHVPESMSRLSKWNLKQDIEFDAVLRKWLTLRYGYITSILANDIANNARGDYLRISRALYIHHRDIDRFKKLVGINRGAEIGKHWSTIAPLPWGAFEPDMVKITVTGMVAWDDVDIIQTLRARTCWVNGDGEHEITLKDVHSVKNITVEVV